MRKEYTHLFNAVSDAVNKLENLQTFVLDRQNRAFKFATSKDEGSEYDALDLMLATLRDAAVNLKAIRYALIAAQQTAESIYVQGED